MATVPAAPEHSHGLVDDSIKRSREGVRAVGLSLAVLGGAAVAQTAIFVATGSVALLADLVHNFGDAATAFPLGAAFLLRSDRAERAAGLAVVAAIFISACVAGVEAVSRLIHPSTPSHLAALAGAGIIGFVANAIAARIRSRRARARRCLRQPRGRRERRDDRRRHPDSRPADRPGDHPGHPAHHVGLVEDGPAHALTIIISIGINK
jgi:Co/Zn/Cd efflux system component